MDGYPWGPLRDEAAEALSQIPASFDTFSGITLHPAGVRLENGEHHDAVIFLRLSPDEGDWAEEEGRQGRCIQPEDVVSAYPSPHRLPAVLADRLYELGAATKRDYRYDILFGRGQKVRVHCTQVVDFPDLPPGCSAADAREAHPVPDADGEDGEMRSSLPFKWCYYIWPRLPGDPEM